MGGDGCTRDLAAPTLGGFCVDVAPWIGSLKVPCFQMDPSFQTCWLPGGGEANSYALFCQLSLNSPPTTVTVVLG